MRYGPDAPEQTYVTHAFEEFSFDTGEVTLNYASAGNPSNPAILLIPGQTESWWGYEAAIPLLAEHLQVYAVDLRGQGRSSRTSGRYTFDNFGNDLVRFVGSVIGRPCVVSGLSSGGVIAAWLSAYAPREMIRGAHSETPPLFAAELAPACGNGIRQGAGPLFRILHKYLGDQWSVGDVSGLVEAAPFELPPWLAPAIGAMVGSAEAPAQNLKEYDPEWGRAFWTGSVGATCDHEQMLAEVKCPVLFTHHFRRLGEQGTLLGAISDLQVDRVTELVTGAGQPFDYQTFPEMPHSMHGANPALYAQIVGRWIASLAE